MRKPGWLYWITPVHVGGMPVTFTLADGRRQRYRWRGIYGLAIGSWFIGGIRAHYDPHAALAAGEEPDA